MNERRESYSEPVNLIGFSKEDEQLMVMVMNKMNKLYQQQAESKNVQNN